jgi:hypothetical protein
VSRTATLRARRAVFRVLGEASGPLTDRQVILAVQVPLDDRTVYQALGRLWENGEIERVRGGWRLTSRGEYAWERFSEKGLANPPPVC